MRISYAIPCRHLEPLADGTDLAVGIGQDGVITDVLPLTVHATLLVGVAISPEDVDAGLDHRFAVVVLDPELEEVHPRAEYPIPARERHPLQAENWDLTVRLPLQVVFEATRYGTYTIELEADDASASVPFRVIQPPS